MRDIHMPIHCHTCFTSMAMSFVLCLCSVTHTFPSHTFTLIYIYPLYITTNQHVHQHVVNGTKQAAKISIHPKIKDIDLLGAPDSKQNEESRDSTAQAQLFFNPSRKGDQQSQAQDIQTFLSGLESINTNAVLFTGINKTPYAKTTAAGKCPPTIREIAENIEVNEDSNEEICIQAISLTSEQCETNEQASRCQKNDVWWQ